MKTLIFTLALMGIAWATPIQAQHHQPIILDGIVIPLIKGHIHENPDWDKGGRSVSYPPIAVHDNQAIYLYAYETMQDVTLTVTDSQGNVVNSALVTVHPDQPAMLMLDAENGSYRLEVTYKEDYYYGEFEIE